jgi:hypothetical protein
MKNMERMSNQDMGIIPVKRSGWVGLDMVEYAL